MKAGVGIDLYTGQFSSGETAAMLGIKSSVLAMRAQRGYIKPTRREGSGATTPRKKRLRRGRGLLSVQEIVAIRIQQVLLESGFLLNQTIELGDESKETPKPIAAQLLAFEATEFADTVAMTGEWMWAVARAFERGKKLHVYLYATRQKGTWQFDMHAVNLGEPPCFGWEVPHVYLPLSEIFISVYTACKKLLGIAEQNKGLEA